MGIDCYDFSVILEKLKEGKKASRTEWGGGQDINIFIQFPDENSKMTMPYMVMNKRGEMFPLDLSCEAIMAEDWFIVN